MMKKPDDRFVVHPKVEVVCEGCGTRSAVSAATRAWPKCPCCDGGLMVRFDVEKHARD